MQVPLLDLSTHHSRIRGEIDDAIRNVIDAGAFCGGPFVETFEREFAAFCGADYAIGVGSGTDALWLTLMALGIGAGDTVITVPNTFIATAEAISMTGATPVFVDVDPFTYTMDPVALEAAITSDTMAIIPVHLYGHPADMDPIQRIADKHGIPVIEDACQAHGALYKDRMAGTLGFAGCFSFYPSKNLGAFGEAGAVLTSDADLCRILRMLRDHGQEQRHQHEYVGTNGRMDGIQAAVLSTKLRYLPDYIESRRRVAAQYDSAIATGIEGIYTPHAAWHAKHVYHLYALRVPDRDAFMASLNADGIHCGIHYPTPIHHQAAYRHLGFKEAHFPVAERLSRELVSLPMYPELAQAQVDAVIDSVSRSNKQSRRTSSAYRPPERECEKACMDTEGKET